MSWRWLCHLTVSCVQSIFARSNIIVALSVAEEILMTESSLKRSSHTYHKMYWYYCSVFVNWEVLWEATQLISLSASDSWLACCDSFQHFLKECYQSFHSFLGDRIFSFSLLGFHPESHFIYYFFFVHYFFLPGIAGRDIVKNW